MRKELDEAQKKVTTMKRSVHVAEKNLHVTQLDQNNLSKEVAQNVAKIDSLVDIARKMREHRAEMREDINATRRKHTQTQKVVFTMQLCNLSTSDLMPTFLVFFQAPQLEALKSKEEKLASNRKKPVAQKREVRMRDRLQKIRGTLLLYNPISITLAHSYIVSQTNPNHYFRKENPEEYYRQES